MIPGISEVNFQAIDGKQVATLHQATVTFVDMGERTIETQVRIDGDITPNFEGWELEYKNERFVLPIRDPQAAKDNTTRNSLVDLTFRSWVVEELKRYFFFTTDPQATSTAVPDQYQASVKVNLSNFVQIFARVLNYYWPNSEITIDLSQVAPPTAEPVFEIDHLKVWDVLTRFHEIYGVRWYFQPVAIQGGYRYVIKVGYDAPTINDHVFEYGYDGGLMRFERQVQDENITNVLLGRGGEKNLPYRYFKKSLEDSGHTWTGDPDAIPELQNIYFDRLHDVNFRWYVRGWMWNGHRDRSGDEAWDPGHTFPYYTDRGILPSSPYYISSSSPYYWAFYKGRYIDENFNPVEYVGDEFTVQTNPQAIIPKNGSSIKKYGEHWGVLDDDDSVFPTLQGSLVNDILKVSPINNDDRTEAAEDAARITNIDDLSVSLFYNLHNEFDILSDPFTIPSGWRGAIWYRPFSATPAGGATYNTDDSIVTVVPANNPEGESGGDAPTKNADGEYVIQNIPAGQWRVRLQLVVDADPSTAVGTFGIESVKLYLTRVQTDAWKPTFEVWIRNIWNTHYQDAAHRYETEQEYAERVWLPILGNHLGNEAALIFCTGPMSGVSDYEFKLAALPEYDPSVTEWGSGNQSEWKLTLYKSDAELEATGLFIPNAQVKPQVYPGRINFPIGDEYYFIGIDMPFQYVYDAEVRLNTNKSGQLESFSDIAPTWVIGMDKVRVHTQEQADRYGILADRLKAGMLLKITDPRFAPGNDPLELYAQSVTYRWQEPSDQSPYIVPDVEVVLSDKVIPQLSTVGQLQGDVRMIKADYIRADQVEEVIRRLASTLFLKKTGEEDTSESPTRFASRLTSKDFVAGGVGGSGWGLYRNNSEAIASNPVQEGKVVEGKAVMEVDNLIVRDKLTVNTFVVNQITAQGGKEVLSAARIEVSQVIKLEGEPYRCYFDQKQGSIANLFRVGDIALCQRYGPDWSDEERYEYYRMIVSKVGLDYIELDPSTSDDSEQEPSEPAVGDVIVQFGHCAYGETPADPARQSVIIRDVIGGGYEQMISGLTAEENPEEGGWMYSVGTEYFFAGRQPGRNGGRPTFFIGSKDANGLGQFMEYDGQQLTIRGKLSVNSPTEEVLKAGSTTIDGDLIQTGEIVLGQALNGVFSTYAGVSGKYNEDIAAWYGGDKIPIVDSAGHRIAANANKRYAKSLFRFDGSGYLAGGGIFWNENGYGGIPGITWDASGITIATTVKLPGGQQSLVEAVRELNQMFTLENTGTDANPVYRIKANYGLYSDSFITACGIGQPGGGGGGGSTVSWVQRYPSTGERIATITIDGSSIDVYAPRGGSDASLDVNTDDATITVGSNSATFYKKAKVDSLLSGYATVGSLNNYIGKVSGATAGNIAIFASGGGLADSGIHNSALALLPSNNQFTGKNTFTQSIWTHGVVLTDYSDAIYGRTGAEDYVPIFRIYTNIADPEHKGDLNFGIDPGEGGTATHDVSFIGASIYFRNKHWSDTNATLLALQDSAISAYRNIEPGSDGTLNLGASSLMWNNAHIKRWYPKPNDTNIYVEYDSSTNSFHFHGNILADGYITALNYNGNPNV